MSDSRADNKPSGAPSKAWSLSLSKRGLCRLLIATRLQKIYSVARSPQDSREEKICRERVARPASQVKIIVNGPPWTILPKLRPFWPVCWLLRFDRPHPVTDLLPHPINWRH
jgi:hypothetical protein